MFAKLLLKKIEFDLVTMQHAAYFLILFSKSYIFETKVFLEIQKQYFKILVIKKHWQQSGFLFRFRNLVFCQNGNLSRTIESILCCGKQTFYPIWFCYTL